MRYQILALALLPATLCAQTPDAAWREYLDWFRAQPSESAAGRPAYLEHLRKTGLSPTAAEQRATIVERLMKERRDEWQPIFFDKTYSNSKPRFNPEPNAFLAEIAGPLRPGRALDIHMGQGRNAVFLAKKGWDVTGFDFSPVAVEAANRAASAAGVRLTTRVCRHEDFDFGSNRWDLIVMSYTWLPLDAIWTERIIRSLRPGGRLVFEHLMDESGSENRTAWLPRPNELPLLFGRLRIIRYEDTSAKADWSWRPERVARLLAERDLKMETVPLKQ